VRVLIGSSVCIVPSGYHRSVWRSLLARSHCPNPVVIGGQGSLALSVSWPLCLVRGLLCTSQNRSLSSLLGKGGWVGSAGLGGSTGDTPSCLQMVSNCFGW
jgi:hypothetical protein